MDVEKRIVSIIKNVSGRMPNNYKDLDLLEEGILDSLSIMQMIVEIDEEFDIELDVDDIVSENFNSVTHIAELVSKYLK